MRARLGDLEKQAQNPVLVVDAVEKALRSRHPNDRYQVGPLYQTFLTKLPVWLFDSLVQKFYMVGIKPRASKL